MPRKSTLIGDAPGLGKTIQAIGIANLTDGPRILIICPGFLKPHWQREFKKWDVKGRWAEYVKDGKDKAAFTFNVVIINYELLQKFREELRSVIWDLLVVDEVHKLKNKRTDRTREVWGGIKRNSEGKIVERVSPIQAQKYVYMTGTPSLNGKPKELWPLLQQCDPTGLGADWFRFAKRYCKLVELTRYDGRRGKLENNYQVHVGWKWDGADNLEELQERMRLVFMVRRLKEWVMKDLKPKIRLAIPIEVNSKIKKLLEEENRLFDDYAKGRNLDEIEIPEFGEFAAKMQEIGLSMVKPTIEVIEHELDNHEKIVVICFHRGVADAIQKELHKNGIRTLDYCGKKSGARQTSPQNNTLPMQMREDKTNLNKQFAFENVNSVPQLRSDEARSKYQQDERGETMDRGEKSGKERENSVYYPVDRFESSEKLSAIGNSSPVVKSEMVSEQSVSGQNRFEEGLYEEQHLDSEFTGEQIEKQRDTSGVKIAVEKFGKENFSVKVDGEIDPEERQKAVDIFQNNPNCRVFIGTFGSCSEGFTLTSSHLMIFPERSWVPGQVTQAEDRIHRRGQKEQAVYKHLVPVGSLADRQINTLFEKQERADKMLDKQTDKR